MGAVSLSGLVGRTGTHLGELLFAHTLVWFCVPLMFVIFPDF